MDGSLFVYLPSFRFRDSNLSREIINEAFFGARKSSLPICGERGGGFFTFLHFVVWAFVYLSLCILLYCVATVNLFSFVPAPLSKGSRRKRIILRAEFESLLRSGGRNVLFIFE